MLIAVECVSMPQIKIILEKYKNRLIDISSKNRTLCLTKLYKSRYFDLALLEKHFNGITAKILESITNERGKKVCILDVENANINYSWTVEQELKDFSYTLRNIKREINFIEKETGRYELFVAYPFVEGKFLDGTYAKAPLFLFPVGLDYNNGKWYLQRIEGEEIFLNKVFLIAYKNYNSAKIVEKDYEGDFSLEKITEYFESIGIKLYWNKSTQIERFQEGKRENTPPGTFELKNYIILGDFKIASSIYNDYQILENKAINNKILRLLLTGEKKESSSIYEYSKDIDQIDEKNFYYISKLDFSQEKAIIMANKKDGIVIYGPPGTGKSQTISNLIADYLAKGKKVLVVSEKRAALDVVLNRLSPIKNKIMLVHDAQKEKKEIYKKISHEYTSVINRNIQSEIQKIRNASKKIETNSNKIIDNLTKLEEFSRTMYGERDFGLSLANMYTLTNKNLDDNEIKLFQSFRNHFNGNYKYDDIKKSCNWVRSEREILEKYLKYRDIQEEYKEQIKDVKNVLDSLLIKYISNEISNLQIEWKINFYSKHKDEIKKALQEKEDLETLVKRINEKMNPELFKSFRKLSKLIARSKWYNPISIILLRYRRNKFEKIEKIIKEKENEIINEVKSDFERGREFLQKVEILKYVIDDFSKFESKILDGQNLEKYIEKLKVFLSDYYEEYYKLYLQFSELSEIDIDILEFMYKQKDYETDFILDRLERFFVLNEIAKIEQEEKPKILKYDVYYDTVKDVIESMENKMKTVQEYIINYWNNEFIRVLKENEILSKNFERQINKKSKLLSIRELIEKFGSLVFSLFPCFLATPETVSEILPLNEGMFDIVIFDEASQIFIEKSIPVIYRANKVVVSGDDKQLKPFSTFMVREEQDEEFDMEISAAMEEESLLDVAKVNFDSTHLLFHYRSEYRELIEFSNHAFYDGRLYISPNISNAKAIERIKVNGTWKNNQNKEEAEEIVKLVKEILKERKERETIGIVTFNVHQRNLIYDLLDEESTRDPEFRELYEKESNRYENGEDKSIFVKNIENVQGDERDIIIFSTSYAKDQNGKFRFNFGPLSQEGGENRLNVAISRARKKIYVVTSFEPEELEVESSKNMGPKLLKEYLKYVRAISNGNIIETEEILYSLSNVKEDRILKFDSPFEEEVYEYLKNSHVLKRYGLELHSQVSSSGYRIDLGVYDKKLGKYIVGIECDGARYHSSLTARERDIHRQRFLESRGWKIVRIWSRDWWQDKEGQIQKVEKIIEDEIEEKNDYLSEIV